MKDRNAFKAGLFIIISIALVVAILIGMRGFERLLEPHAHYVVTFKLTDDVSGLATGSEVRVGGMKVGAVKDVRLVTDDAAGPHIRATISMPQKISLRADAHVTIQAMLVGGTAQLNIDKLGSGPLAKPGDVLVGNPSGIALAIARAGDLAEEAVGAVRDVRQTSIPKVNLALDKAADTFGTFKETGTSANGLLKHVETKVEPAMDDYHQLAATAKDALAKAGSLVGDIAGDFRTTIANLSHATGTIKEKLPPVMDKIDGVLVKVASAVDQANAALEDVKKTATNARDLTASARDVLVSNRGKLDNMIASLKTTGDNLKAASSEVRRSPWRLLYKPEAGEMGNLNLFDSTRQFAEGASDLNDASAALRDALKNPAVRDEDVKKLLERLEKSFDHFKGVEDELWKQVKE